MTALSVLNGAAGWMPENCKAESTWVQINYFDCPKQAPIGDVAVWLLGLRKLVSEEFYRQKWPEKAA